MGRLVKMFWNRSGLISWLWLRIDRRCSPKAKWNTLSSLPKINDISPTPLVVNLKTYFSFGEHLQSILHYLNCVSKPAYVTANLYLYSFFYFSPIFGLLGKPKYRANTFSIFISFILPFLSLLAVSITLLLWTLVFKIFTDPGLQKVHHSSLVCHWKCMLTSARNVKFIKMRLFTMFITAVCVLFLTKFIFI